MINFRKLRQDFSSNIIKEGKDLYDKQKVVSAKLIQLDGKLMKVGGRVLGQYDNCYESEIEIDRGECEAIDSNCDCPYNYDCQHIAALLFFLEENLDKILVDYSKETSFEEMVKEDHDEEAKSDLIEKVKKAESKEVLRQEELYQKQLLQEYVVSSEVLAVSPFFRTQIKPEIDKADMHLIFSFPSDVDTKNHVEVQIALRLPYRSKPLHIPHLKAFFEAVRYEEPIFMSSKKYCFAPESFETGQREILKTLMEHIRFSESSNSEKSLRGGYLDLEVFGLVVSGMFEAAFHQIGQTRYLHQDDELPYLTGLYEGSLEQPIRFSPVPAGFRFVL